MLLIHIPIFMANLTPVATKKSTSTTTATYTFPAPSKYVVVTNTDATIGITIAVNAAAAVAKEGIYLSAKQTVILDMKELGAVIKKISYISDSGTPVLAFQIL